MSRFWELPSYLLTLPLWKRLALGTLSLLVFLVLFLPFPLLRVLPEYVRNPALFCVPLVLNSWLFGKRGAWLCTGCTLLALWASASLTTASVFLPAPLVCSLLEEVLVLVIVGTLISMLRDALQCAESERSHTVQSYEKLELSQQLRDQWVANTTHELRTSLTSVSGYLDLLDEHKEVLDEKARAMFLTYAREGCGELVQSVNTILDTIRENAEARELHFERVAVAPAVREVVDHLAPQLVRDHPIHLEVDRSINVYADQQSLRLVLRNLLSNALKYTPRQTPIIVEARAAAIEGTFHTGQVCISVQDRGPGIPQDEQAHIFQQFVRLDRDASGSKPGSGLGLYICKQLVEEMGGRIWVESSGTPGEGCRFCFLLPAACQAVSEERTYYLALTSLV